LPVPHKEGWGAGSWNHMLSSLTPLARLLGCNTPNPTLDELQDMLSVASSTVFSDAQDAFREATGGRPVNAVLRMVDQRSGLNRKIPFRSVKKGRVDPATFNGVAFWLGGTVSFMHLRKEQIELQQLCGAWFERIIVLGGTRTCGKPDDRRHPRINQVYPEGQEPTERVLQKSWVFGDDGLNPQYVFPELPDKNPDGSDTSLAQQLMYFSETGQYERYVGDRPVYVPSNFNGLSVPLYYMRLMGLDDIYTSQDSGVADTPRPDYWCPWDVELMNLPSGILRVWKEARQAGYINDKAPTK
jgi:hypothetical protein